MRFSCFWLLYTAPLFLLSCAYSVKRLGSAVKSQKSFYDSVSEKIFVSGENLVFEASLIPLISTPARFTLETIDSSRICDSKSVESQLEANKTAMIFLSAKKSDCTHYRLTIEPIKETAKSAFEKQPKVERLALSAISFTPLAVNCRGLECSSEIKLSAILTAEPNRTYKKVRLKLTGWAKDKKNLVVNRNFVTKVVTDDTGKAKIEEYFTIPVDVSVFDFEGEVELLEVEE